MKLFFLISSTILLSPVFAQDTVYCVELNQPDFQSFALFNQDITNKKVILLGEMHYMAPNSAIQTELLIHLNKQFGIRHLLIEFGRAEAYLYNQYLKTGESWYINHTFHGYKGYVEFLSAWKELYNYNLRLDDSKKLKVHGLDLEREPGLSASLYTLLEEYTANPEVVSLRDSLRVRLDTIGVERDAKEYIYHLRNSIPTHSFPDGENKQIINDILYNQSFVSSMQKRDSLMAEAFMALDTTNEVYLGQFGFAHSWLNGKNSLAAILNNLAEYHNKILVTNMHYVNSNNNQPFEGLSDCQVYLYKIDPEDDKLGGFAKRGQWALILKDQNLYTQKE